MLLLGLICSSLACTRLKERMFVQSGEGTNVTYSPNPAATEVLRTVSTVADGTPIAPIIAVVQMVLLSVLGAYAKRQTDRARAGASIVASIERSASPNVKKTVQDNLFTHERQNVDVFVQKEVAKL